MNYCVLENRDTKERVVFTPKSHDQVQVQFFVEGMFGQIRVISTSDALEFKKHILTTSNTVEINHA
jgi:hypothetical protein